MAAAQDALRLHATMHLAQLLNMPDSSAVPCLPWFCDVSQLTSAPLSLHLLLPLSSQGRCGHCCLQASRKVKGRGHRRYRADDDALNGPGPDASMDRQEGGEPRPRHRHRHHRHRHRDQQRDDGSPADPYGRGPSPQRCAASATII